MDTTPHGATRRSSIRTALALVISVSWAGGARAGAYDDYFKAIEMDNAPALADLLARGMDPNTRDPRGQHGLFLALRGGSGKSFRLLMQHPETQVEASNAAGETPLMMAALRADIEAMKTLLARGAQVQREGWTPLHYAASSPSDHPVRLLLELGAPIDARAPNGNTPLMQAARYGTEGSVALLLEKGADRTLLNSRNLDAAAYARLDGREAVARWLETGRR